MTALNVRKFAKISLAIALIVLKILKA